MATWRPVSRGVAVPARNRWLNSLEPLWKPVWHFARTCFGPHHHTVPVPAGWERISGRKEASRDRRTDCKDFSLGDASSVKTQDADRRDRVAIGGAAQRGWRPRETPKTFASRLPCQKAGPRPFLEGVPRSSSLTRRRLSSALLAGRRASRCIPGSKIFNQFYND